MRVSKFICAILILASLVVKKTDCKIIFALLYKGSCKEINRCCTVCMVQRFTKANLKNSVVKYYQSLKE